MYLLLKYLYWKNNIVNKNHFLKDQRKRKRIIVWEEETKASTMILDNAHTMTKLGDFFHEVQKKLKSYDSKTSQLLAFYIFFQAIDLNIL